MRFDDLIGQETALQVLKKAVMEQRITNSYLFAGQEGVGKLAAALAFAAALNCENPTESGDSCGTCLQCRLLSADGHPDVEIISPDGSETKIKQMQSMRSTSHYAPVSGKWKVVIIEQADTLNEDSSSCILKTLEEPPGYLVIILLSRNPALLLQTIRSRCLQVRFSSIPVDVLSKALVDRFGIDSKRAEFLAAYSQGRPGRAISMMKNESFDNWRERIIDLAERITSSDRRYALRLSEDMQELIGDGKDDGMTQRAAMKVVLDGLLLWYQDLLNISIRGEQAELANSDIRDRFASILMSPGRAASAIETIFWAKRAIEGNANIQLISDVAMIRLTS